MAKVLFYASVADKNEFNYKFYKYAVNALEYAGYEVECTNQWKDYKSKSYDYAYLYFLKKALIPGLIAKFKGKKVLFAGGCDDIQKQANPNFLSRLKFKIVAYLCIWVATAVNVENTEDQKLLSKIAGFNFLKRKIKCFPLSVELPDVGDLIQKDLKMFLTICWMKTKDNAIRKGVIDSLYVFEQLFQNDPNLNYYILGDGQETIDWIKQTIISKLESKGNIHFLGLVSEVEKIHYLKNALFYFQLSSFEGLGVSAIEAVMNNCIVIHSNRGGLKDYMPNYAIKFPEVVNIVEDVNKCQLKYSTLSSQMNIEIAKLRELFSYQRRAILLKEVYNSNH
jgi:glycosyltransferase involved in cell wall biosynthesis